MSTIITSVDRHSPAERAGITPGEQLLTINGHQIIDVLDYRFYGYDTDCCLELREPAGTVRTVSLRKPEGRDLGLNFDTVLMDDMRSCANHCVFCFVDQMPKGMRDTLYFKDDDARLSFLMGNYITLTNLSKREIQRICDLHISPINISVHATDPEVRRELLGNYRRGGECLEIMQKFAQAGIVMNAQIVSCPGLNDGPVLQKSMEELAALVDTAGGDTVAIIMQSRPTPDPRSFIGDGKVREMKELIAMNDCDLAVFDNELTPSQMRVLSEELGVKVLDRSGLILDIFAQRAQTREGQLQVELAQYKYLLPRLTGMWTHLVRQTASGGSSPIGTRGPGETQLETDRRHIRRKIQKLQAELEDVRKIRRTQRRRREKNALPVVALVGYTNAGKSTLLNCLTG